MAFMKAMQIYRYGAPDVFVAEEVARPTPGVGEVLVRVRAVGINPIDVALRAGYVAEMMGNPPLPLILGWDISGEVVATGEGVTAFVPGDEVYGLNHFPRLVLCSSKTIRKETTQVAAHLGEAAPRSRVWLGG